MKRMRAEAMLAVLFAGAVMVGGSVAIYFVSTMSVHTDPGSVPSTAAAAPDERYSSAVDQARRLTRSLVVDENLPGFSVAVAVDGGIVWAESFSWADVERRAPVTPLTRFRIGSVSMPLTAAAVGLLHERGRLDIDAPVQQYVSAFPEKQWPFSTRQLMGHVAGIQHEGMPPRPCSGLDEALQVFDGDPLRFRPGTRYLYSFYGWVLVSAVVEAAAAEPFFTFMNREVLAPAGMERTVPDEADGVPDRASFYFPRTSLRTDLGLQDAPEADYSCFAGAGVFLSTPSDLVRFGSAMLRPGLLKADTIALLQTPLLLESGASTGYALGWRAESVQLAGAPARLLSHQGTPMGGTVSLMTFPDLGLAIAVATNVSHATSVAPFGLKIADVFARQAR
jgi:CubicO group peptidase (beta-lactamase class C family)